MLKIMKENLTVHSAISWESLNFAQGQTKIIKLGNFGSSIKFKGDSDKQMNDLESGSKHDVKAIGLIMYSMATLDFNKELLNEADP